jgi:hypothetical protein
MIIGRLLASDCYRHVLCGLEYRLYVISMSVLSC